MRVGGGDVWMESRVGGDVWMESRDGVEGRW